MITADLIGQNPPPETSAVELQAAQMNFLAFTSWADINEWQRITAANLPTRPPRPRARV